MKKFKVLISGLVLALLCTMSTLAQVQVSGTVTDNVLGEPIIGASVVEVGTTNGTITDLDGNFTLQVKSGAQLQFSFVGYVTQVLAAAPNMNVVLAEDNELLEEVVVTGYTTQRKADLTGSVAVVQTKGLKTSSDTDPMRALQGKVAGMTITSNGSPAATATVRIRGVRSTPTRILSTLSMVCPPLRPSTPLT